MGRGYTQLVPAPSPGRLFLCFFVLSTMVFLRPPSTNFIFDEQEALLGNPYLHESSAFLDALKVDFWGRAPARTIGSYRPLPNLLWWPLRATLKWNTPWFFCWLNLLFHAGAATLLALSVEKIAQRTRYEARFGRLLVWGLGFWFVLNACSTEAVCSAVGLADILLGFFTAAQLFVLLTWTEQAGKLGDVAAVGLCGAAMYLGLLSKETMLASIVWIPLATILCAPRAWKRDRVFMSAVGTLVAGVAVILGFVHMRVRFFPAEATEISSFVRGDPSGGAFAVFFEWFRQPKMPVDPLNNPLLGASTSDQWATGCRLFLEQLVQIFFPWGLCADHSFPRTRVASWGAFEVTGALTLLGLVGLGLEGVRRRWVRGASTIRWTFGAGGALLFICGYLPISNLLVLLPSVRGDRLLYVPVLGAAFLLAAPILGLRAQVEQLSQRGRRVVQALLLAYLCFHGLSARLHALNYNSDIAFWRATSRGNPASAKSHLNLGVMVGARGDERARLRHSLEAVRLAPEWPMGQVYLGDVYCRLGDIESAWPHYAKGFSDSPNSRTLIALGLQCLWEKEGFKAHRSALLNLAAAHPDTWLDYLVTELVVHGHKHGGVPKKYRPRKYNGRASLK